MVVLSTRLPDIFELNDYLHTIDCESAYSYDYYMIDPIGTIDFEEKKNKNVILMNYSFIVKYTP